MISTDVWPMVVRLRRELVDQLADLPDAAWDVPSLCPGWRVRDVVAHTVMPARFRLPGGVPGLLRARLRLARVFHDDAVRRGSAPIPDLVATFRAAIERTTTPPGRRPEHVLADLFVHVQDVRRPLGLRIPDDSPARDGSVLALVADVVARDRVIGTADLTGVHLRATDAPWRHGSGAEVTGPGEALILAMTGRDTGDELDGPGVRLLLP